MNYWCSPFIFHLLAISFYEYRWRFILYSSFSFIFYLAAQHLVTVNTANIFIWLVIFSLFAALQLLVIAAFIFFFASLASIKEHQPFWQRLYQSVEWIEAILFSFILPLPSLLFIYAFISI